MKKIKNKSLEFIIPEFGLDKIKAYFVNKVKKKILFNKEAAHSNLTDEINKESMIFEQHELI